MQIYSGILVYNRQFFVQLVRWLLVVSSRLSHVVLLNQFHNICGNAEWEIRIGYHKNGGKWFRIVKVALIAAFRHISIESDFEMDSIEHFIIWLTFPIFY